MSSSPRPRATSPDSSWAASPATGSVAPTERASSRAIARSLRWSDGPEPERVLVVDHPAAPVLEHPAARRPAAQRRRDRLGIEAGLEGEHDPLGDAEVGAGDHDLVDGLDRLAAARGAEVRDRLAHRLEDRPGTLGVGRLAAHEDRERRLLRALGAAGDRRVDEADPALPERRGDARGRGGRDRGAVDDEAARGEPLPHPVRAEDDRLHVGRVRDAHDHDVRCAGDVGRRARLRAAQRHQVPGATRRPVPRRDLEAGPAQVGGHRRPHRPQPDEPDPFHAVPPARPERNVGRLPSRTMTWLGIDLRRMGTGLLVFGVIGMIVAGIVAVGLAAGAIAARNLDERVAADQARLVQTLERIDATMAQTVTTIGNAGSDPDHHERDDRLRGRTCSAASRRRPTSSASRSTSASSGRGRCREPPRGSASSPSTPGRSRTRRPRWPPTSASTPATRVRSPTGWTSSGPRSRRSSRGSRRSR